MREKWAAAVVCLLVFSSGPIAAAGRAAGLCSAALKTSVSEAAREVISVFQEDLRTQSDSLKLLTTQLQTVRATSLGNSLRVREIVHGVFLFQTDTQRELTRTFLRFQEHYESPRFRGKIFSLKEFKEWYRTTTPSGNFTYFSDWGGFNFPSPVLDPFYAGEFHNLTARENSVLNHLADQDGEPFYVIGTYGSLDAEASVKSLLSTLQHEVAHAFYRQFPEYRRKVDEILSQADPATLRRLSRYFKKIGYDSSVFRDEQHAYLLADWDHLCLRGRISLDPNQETIKKLNRVFLNQLRSAIR